MANLLLKQDQLKFSELAKRILPRKGQGCLVFLTCNRGELVEDIQLGLDAKLGCAFKLQTYPIAIGNAVLGPLPEYDPKAPVLHVLTGYPYTLFEEQDPNLTRMNRSLAEGLNVERDLIPKRNLHLIFIFPQYVEDTLALVAPDFYHFRTFSAHFHDDKVPRRIQSHQNNLAALKRERYLQQKLIQTSNPIHKANIQIELAKLLLSSKDRDQARVRAKKALKIYKKQKSLDGMAEAYALLGNALHFSGFYQQASNAYSAALKALPPHSPARDLLQARLGMSLVVQCHFKKARRTFDKISAKSSDANLSLSLTVDLYYAMLFSYIGKTHEAEKFFRLVCQKFQINTADEWIPHVEKLFLIRTGELDKLQELTHKFPATTNTDSLYAEQVRYILLGEWELAETKILNELGWIAQHQGQQIFHKLSMAFLHFKMGHFDLAEFNAAQALEYCEKIEDELWRRMATTMLVKIQRRTQPFAEVEIRCLKFLDDWTEGPALERAELMCTLGFIYCDTDRLDLALEKVQETLAIAEPASYRYVQGEAAMLLARIQGKQANWDGAYATLKAGYEYIRERDMAMEAEITELLGQAAENSLNPRAKGWYQKALNLYTLLHLPQAQRLAQHLASLSG